MKYCGKCSSIIAESDTQCPNCGAPVEEAANGSGPQSENSGSGQGFSGAQASDPNHDFPPPKYMTQGILALIFCCWPFAIPVLVYNSKAQKLFLAGSKDEAWEASANAKKWLIASIVTGVVVNALVLILRLASKN
jgi:hypothetical protein